MTDSLAPAALPQPSLSLEAPDTFVFTAQRALSGQALNRFALSLRSPAARAAYLRDPTGYEARHGLTAAESAMVRARDWTGLLQAGGHLQALLKLAVTVGEDLWSVGAHTIGCSRDALFAVGPRPVARLPQALDRKAGR